MVRASSTCSSRTRCPRAGLVSRSVRACCTFRACPFFLSNLLTHLLAQADLLAHGAVPLDSGLRRRELLARRVAPRSETRWLSLRSAGALEAAFSARPCPRPPQSPASLGRSAVWMALAGHTGPGLDEAPRPCFWLKACWKRASLSCRSSFCVSSASHESASRSICSAMPCPVPLRNRRFLRRFGAPSWRGGLLKFISRLS